MNVLHRTRPSIRCAVAVVAATAAALVGLTAPTASAAPAAAATTPLPPDLEKIRAAEATKLYGDPAERPLADRRTALISLGDSEISGRASGPTRPARTARTTGVTARPTPPSTAPGSRPT